VPRYEPDGTQVSVRDAAAKMIFLSDNTATDMLINLVGRSAVEAALTATGMANPALNRPFLTTRETYILALDPALAKRYLTANEAGRRALLANTVDRLPLPDVVAAMRTLSTRSTMGNLGWFASASDICRAYAALAALMPAAVARFAPGGGHGWLAGAAELHLRMVEAWITGQELPAELATEMTEWPSSQVQRLLDGR
jgi:beta-lactamase class A